MAQMPAVSSFADPPRGHWRRWQSGLYPGQLRAVSKGFAVKLALPVFISLVLVVPAAAQTTAIDSRCDRIARAQSGYEGGRLPTVEAGPLSLRLSGSVALGVSRSSGGAGVSVPAGAGEGARELRRTRAERAYHDAYAACVAG